MSEDGAGGYRRLDVTKPRLAAMKEAVALEIERQRRERRPSPPSRIPIASGVRGRDRTSIPALKLPVVQPALIRTLPLASLARFRAASCGTSPRSMRMAPVPSSLLALSAVARRYSRQMQREVEEEARLHGRERAA
jgi:hypothetical protein